MAGSFRKGAIPPDPRVVIPKLEDYIDVSSLAGGLPAAPRIIDRESKVKAWPMYANGPDQAAQTAETAAPGTRGRSGGHPPTDGSPRCIGYVTLAILRLHVTIRKNVITPRHYRVA
jgi:hypothetical protein